MNEADIIPAAVYQTTISGRYGSVERMVVKIDTRKRQPRVFYRVRRDGMMSDIVYIMSLERFAESAARRIS